VDVFFHPKFQGAGLPKIVPTLLLPRGTSTEKFLGDIPSSPEVIGALTLNFKPNIKFSRTINIFWETPVLVGVCASYGQSLARVKI